jgi:putative peptidoglycan lipid II flippase
LTDPGEQGQGQIPMNAPYDGDRGQRPHGSPSQDGWSGIEELFGDVPEEQARRRREGAPAPGNAFAHLYSDQDHSAHEQPPHPRERPEDLHGAAPPPPPQPPQSGSAQSNPAPSQPLLPPLPSAAPEAASGPAEGVEEPEPVDEAPAPRSGGKAAGLLRSSAIMAAGTMVSRLTGFVRSALIVIALGTSLLGDSYQIAITLPTMIYILTVGGGLNSVFVPQLVRAMKNDPDGGEAYANRLLTLVSVILGALALGSFFGAPLLVETMSAKIAGNASADDVAVTFVRFCMPSIFFMGIHVVMGQILNARDRFGAMMWTPVLNNLVIIFTVALFLGVYGTASTSGLSVDSIPPEGVRLLGAGTLLGLVVQSCAMIPYLRAAGFRVRPRFDWRGHGLGKAMKLAKWTVLFVLANQAGVIVVSQLSTAAGITAVQSGGHEGTGFIAYSNAQLIWNMPQAIITVSVMAALLPRLSRSAHDGDTGAVRDDISQGLRNSAVAIVPIAFGFLALGIPICTFIYGSAGTEGARSMGYMLMAFGVGLIPFSVQYVVLRAFYAYEDTRTPFYNTVIVAAVNAAASALCFLLLPARWAVVGMAASYGLAYVIGVGVAWRRLRLKLGGDLDGAHVVRTYARLAGASVPATLAAGAASYGITQALGSGYLGSISALLGGGSVLAVVFVLAARRMRVAEMNAVVGMVRARLGR